MANLRCLAIFTRVSYKKIFHEKRIFDIAFEIVLHKLCSFGETYTNFSNMNTQKDMNMKCYKCFIFCLQTQADYLCSVLTGTEVYIF